MTGPPDRVVHQVAADIAALRDKPPEIFWLEYPNLDIADEQDFWLAAYPYLIRQASLRISPGEMRCRPVTVRDSITYIEVLTAQMKVAMTNIASSPHLPQGGDTS